MNTFHHSIKSFQTSSGFTVINIDIPNYPISTTSVWVNAGSRRDPKGKEGLSHLFEHLLFVETKNHPKRNHRLEMIESNGFFYNAVTTLQSQHYFYVHSKPTSKLALETLLDGFFSSTLTEQRLEEEKKVVLSEEKENRVDPSNYIWRLSNKGLWGEHDLGRDFYGTEQSIQSITKKDLDDFFNRYFISENVTFVCINSSLTEDEQRECFNNYAFTNSLENKNENKKVENGFVYEKYTFEHREIETVEAALTFLTTIAKNVHQKALQEFVTAYFASGWISRFIQRLRIENKYIYWIYPEVCVLPDSGYVRFYFSVSKELFEVVLEEIEKEIHHTKNQLINLEGHKNKFKADLERKSVDYTWLMQWYGYTTLVNGEPVNLADLIDAVDAITEDQVQEYISTMFTSERMNISYISNHENKEFLSTFRL